MRKSGWAAATGLGSLVLLLAACGGSSSSSTSAAGGGASGLPSASSGSAPAAAASSATGVSTSSQGGGSTATSTAKAKATPHKSVGPQPSGPSDERSIGYVMAEANHAVLYTYDKDKKGGKPTCVGACAATWLPATGTPQAGPADHFPGQFALVKRSDGTEQISFDGMPLYTLKGAKPLLTTGNGQGGVWHVVKLSASNIG
jgi:predicted lipoprotein with Yx(FWY)xxD motif